MQVRRAPATASRTRTRGPEAAAITRTARPSYARGFGSDAQASMNFGVFTPHAAAALHLIFRWVTTARFLYRGVAGTVKKRAGGASISATRSFQGSVAYRLSPWLRLTKNKQTACQRSKTTGRRIE